MSDPKATKMTLEEAVRIERGGSPRLEDYGNRPDSFSDFSADADRWYRARAIVDQAVKAHRARCVALDNLPLTETDEPTDDDLLIAEADVEELCKLRALERGESEGKP